VVNWTEWAHGCPNGWESEIVSMLPKQIRKWENGAHTPPEIGRSVDSFCPSQACISHCRSQDISRPMWYIAVNLHVMSLCVLPASVVCQVSSWGPLFSIGQLSWFCLHLWSGLRRPPLWWGCRWMCRVVAVSQWCNVSQYKWLLSLCLRKGLWGPWLCYQHRWLRFMWVHSLSIVTL